MLLNCLIVTAYCCYNAGSQDDVRDARGGKLFGNKPDTVVLTTTKGLFFSFACS